MSENIKKKQMLIVFTGAMELGGIERSLLGLLDSIDYEKVDVDLFLYGHHGPLFSQINSKVNILPEVKELAFLRESFITKIKNGCYFSAVMRIRDAIKARYTSVDMDETWAEIMRKYVVKLEKHYDLAISFFRPFDLVNEKVDASIKIGWIHTDYTTEQCDYKVLENDYRKMDLIVAVSEECKKSFCKLFPHMQAKVQVIENIFLPSFVWEKANVFSVQNEMNNENGKILLSIGRFSNAKNFDNVPEICKKIIEARCNIKWFLIGYGNDEELIRKKIKENKMENNVILLGKKENPYPYIKACDLYVQPSRYEGKAVSVREAQVLGKPVVITRYPTSASQLEDGIDGIIVEMDNSACANAIVKLLKDEEKMKQLSTNCLKRDYSNASEIEKLYQLLEA